MTLDITQPGQDNLATCFLFTVEESSIPGLAGSAFALQGQTIVERAKAEINPETRKFTIATKMRSADHQAAVPALGGDVKLSLQEGVTPTGTIEGFVDASNALVGTARSTFSGVALHIESPQGGFDVDPADVFSDITDVPPAQGTVYSHPVPLSVRNGKIVILKGRAVHIIGRCPPGTVKPEPKKECCCKPSCSVEAHGHCTCFHVDSSHKEQLLFAAGSLVKDRVLIYKTITNLGPAQVEIAYDAEPAAPLAPGNSLTVSASRSVKVRYTGPTGSEARGFDVISWCCPPFGDPKPAK